MPLLEKLKTVAKVAFASSDGAAVTLPFGSVRSTPQEQTALVDLSGYLSAMPPLPPTGPADYEMRSRDFVIAENIDYIPLGGKSPILRSFADQWNVLRSMIDTKKDLIAAVPWDIKPNPEPGESKKDVQARAAKDPVVQQLKEFWKCPDGERTWFQWIKQFLEEVIVLDAGCIQMVRDSKKRIAKVVVVSGDTINRVVDDRGWTPAYPQVAYQQVLSGAGAGPEGVPQKNYTVMDILYAMRNPRANHRWGQSSVEKIYQYCLTGILADEFIKDYYTTGNQPPGFLFLSGMTPSQVEDYDKKFNAVYSGNLAAKRRIAMVSAGVGDKSTVQYVATKEPLLKTDIYDQYVRYAAYELSISATALQKPMNRASGQQQAEQSEEEGLVPDIAWLESVINRVIQDPLYFNLPGYSLVFGPRRDIDPVKQMQVDTGYAKNAILTIDEVREELGKEPFKNIPESSEPGVMTPNNGFIPLATDKATAVLQARQQSNSPAPGAGNGQPPKKPSPVQKFAQNSVTTDMPPEEFLAALGDTPESVLATELDHNKVADIRRKMRSGEQIQPSQLDLDADGRVTGHDGRHRAVAAYLEGKEEIQVIVTQPLKIEKLGKISPDNLTDASGKARLQIESKMGRIFRILREKTLSEIANERLLRGKS